MASVGRKWPGSETLPSLRANESARSVTRLAIARAAKLGSLGSLLDGVPLSSGSILGGRSSPACKRVREPVEIEVHHRRREQRQRLADDQAADHRIAERLADFRSGAGAQHQ